MRRATVTLSMDSGKFEEKKFTLGQILDAFIQNGYEQAEGSYWEGDNSTDWDAMVRTYNVGSACAIGQAALNLSVEFVSLEAALDMFRVNDKQVGDNIVRLNDEEHWTVPAIGEHYKQVFADRLEEDVWIRTRPVTVVVEEDNDSI